MTDVIQKIRIDDLDLEQKQLAELIGLDKYKKLLQTYGGMSIYIPKPDSFAATLRNEQIKHEFNGGNYKELSRKFGLTEVWVRNIVADKARELKISPVEGQITLFDFAGNDK